MAAVIATRDEILLQEVWGRRSTQERARIDEDTRFRIASLSKGFSSTVAGMLVAEGAMAWDDRVIEDVEFFTLADPSHAPRATIEHILSHRVGLPHNAYDLLLEANWDPDNIVKRYEQVDPLCDVGTCYGYQNITYDLITDIVDAHSEQDFEDEVSRRIFAPLAMEKAGYGESHLKQDDNYAHPHVKVSRTRIVPKRVATHYYRLPASAGINLSATDLSAWLQAQLGAFPAALGDELRNELWQPRVKTTREMRYGWRRARLDNAWYGLGWRIYDYEGHTVIYHAGAVEGYQAALAVFPEEGVGVALMWNSNSGKPFGAVPVFADALYGFRAQDWMKLDTGGGRTAAASD